MELRAETRNQGLEKLPSALGIEGENLLEGRGRAGHTCGVSEGTSQQGSGASSSACVVVFLF